MEEYVSCGYRPPIAVRQFEQQPALVVHSGETTVQFPVRQSYHDLFAYPLGAIEPCRTYRQDTFAFPAPPPCEQIPRNPRAHRFDGGFLPPPLPQPARGPRRPAGTLRSFPPPTAHDPAHPTPSLSTTPHKARGTFSP